MCFSSAYLNTAAKTFSDRVVSISSSKNVLAKTSTESHMYRGTTVPFNLDREVSVNHSKPTENTYANSDDIQRLRLQFSAEDGLIRPLLLAFTPDNAATDGFDYGYDALAPDQYPNDMFWDIAGNNYVIQGVGAFDNTKIYPLNINVTNAGSIHIRLTGLENFESEIDVFVYDALLNTYTAINASDYEITLDAFSYINRFYVAFTSAASLLSEDENEAADLLISYLIHSHEIIIKSLDLLNVKKIHLINLFGQTVKIWDHQDFNAHGGDLRMPVHSVAEGTYIIKVETFDSTHNKKAIIRY